MFTSVPCFSFFPRGVTLVEIKQFNCAKPGVIVMSPTKVPNIVVGIDFGTTFSGYIFLRSTC